MKRTTAIFLSCILSITGLAQKPIISYFLTVDRSDLSSFSVEMQIKNCKGDFQLAMASHPEYDDKYWRYVEGLKLETKKGAATVVREDSSLWRIRTNTDEVTISYRIHIPSSGYRGAWRPFIASNGAQVGDIHSFMYVVGETSLPSQVRLKIPAGWKIATALTPTSDPNVFLASSVDVLTDSPILIGELKNWSFTVDNVPHHISYWPLLNAKEFDEAALVSAVKKMVEQVSMLFGRLPYREYNFLFQDDSYGALEHLNSVTVGLPSDQLAKDINSSLPEIAHEYFHSWNLMRIHPDGYGEISYTKPPLSNGLWVSEGFTMFYADLLLRRAGLPAEEPTRIRHLENLIKQYYNNKGNTIMSAEKVSLASYGPADMLGDYMASTHLQGELIAVSFDLFIRDKTNGKRSLDDLMRLLMEHFSSAKGFTSKDVEQAVAEISGSDIHEFFRDHISGNKTIDINKYLQLIGLRSSVTWKEATGEDGKPSADLRIYAWRASGEDMIRLGIIDPSSCWGKAGLHTGDIISNVNDKQIKTDQDFWQTLRSIKISDTVNIDIQKTGGIKKISVPVTGYQSPEVHISELQPVNEKQQRLQAAWIRGN